MNEIIGNAIIGCRFYAKCKWTKKQINDSKVSPWFQLNFKNVISPTFMTDGKYSPSPNYLRWAGAFFSFWGDMGYGRGHGWQQPPRWFRSEASPSWCK